jgi:hypothetical protein
VTLVNFEVKGNGWIMYPNSHIVNMLTRQEIHAHYASIDPRIPPYAQYEEIDNRPYFPVYPINFYLQQSVPIEDRSDNPPCRSDPWCSSHGGAPSRTRLTTGTQ